MDENTISTWAQKANRICSAGPFLCRPVATPVPLQCDGECPSAKLPVTKNIYYKIYIYDIRYVLVLKLKMWMRR